MLIKDEEGKEMILSYLNRGDFIGELGLFEEGRERSAWVRAKPHVKWPKSPTKNSVSSFRLTGYPDAPVVADGSPSAGDLRKVGNLAFLDVTGRIAQTLLNWQNSRMR